MQAFMDGKGLLPGDLLNGNLKDQLEGVDELQQGRSKITFERIDALLNRGFALGVEMNRWAGAGLWVLSYLDNHYPKRLLPRLGKRAPPLLFGCGSRELLQRRGLAIIGSQRAPEEDLRYAHAVGCAAAEEGVTIISGGDMGIGQNAVFGALSRGGSVIGVVADRLLERATRRPYMHYLIRGDDFTLVSVVPPGTRLSRWATFDIAAKRSNYIYCLSDASLVVHCIPNRGETWKGVNRNLKYRWIPLWIRSNTQNDGNDALQQLEAKSLPVGGSPQNHLRQVASTIQIREAVLLLTVALAQDNPRISPIDFREWGVFAQSLRHLRYTPADLLSGRLPQQRRIGRISIDRIRALLQPVRKAILGHTRDTWDCAGIWTLMRSDPAYPKTLKKSLWHECPAILFGYGDQILMEQGEAIVFKAESRDEACAIGTRIGGSQQVLVVRGDTVYGKAAMLSALEEGGKAIAVLAGGLLNFSAEADIQKFVRSGSLVLVSAVHPEASIAPEGSERAVFHDRCLRALLHDEPEEDEFLRAQRMLRDSVGNSEATFRRGQWEAIEALVSHRQKILVVERTGWGKSMVYFLTTRLLRDRGRGPTIIISPLLALMRNQVSAAKRVGLRSATINSTNKSYWNRVRANFSKNRIDLLLIAPERLANQSFMDNFLRPIAGNVGLMVIDEVHCISDWGHDFRPDYRRIANVLHQMPKNMPIIGTTATANDRVITDIQEILGDLHLQRGPLRRNSLALQCLVLPDKEERLAWLAKHIPKLPGTGIIYTLTKNDAATVAQWLEGRGIAAFAYHSGIENREQLEQLLYDNKIKVLVATVALAMGYDKPDISFVINYQVSGSIIAYYQQVGRAGRAIDHAYGIMLSGREDGEIAAFFRENAFPSEEAVEKILALLERSDGLSELEIKLKLDVGAREISKALSFLSAEIPAPIIATEGNSQKKKKRGVQYRRTGVRYEMDTERIQNITSHRLREWIEIQDYVNTEECRMAFLQRALNDSDTSNCGRCDICTGKPLISPKIRKSDVFAAKQFLRSSDIPLQPKINIPKGVFKKYGFGRQLPPEWRAEEGKILSRWGDAGWGPRVRKGRKRGTFSNNLVKAVASMVRLWKPNPPPQWITVIPSLRNPSLVRSFAERLAQQLDLSFHPVIVKTKNNKRQKSRKSTVKKCKNLDGVFRLKDDLPDGPVLLVDDVVDSGWTLTVAAALLRQAGTDEVYPVALASQGG